MRLTKTATLKDLKDAAALQAWQLAQQVEKGDLTEFQRAYLLNELAASFLQLSIDIIDAHDLKRMMGEVKPTVVKPTKPARTRKPAAKKPPAKKKANG